MIHIIKNKVNKPIILIVLIKNLWIQDNLKIMKELTIIIKNLKIK